MINSDEQLLEQYTSGDHGLIPRFLGVKKYKMKIVSKSYPTYKKALFFKAISEVKKSYEVRTTFGMQWGEIVTARFQHLEVGRNINEELMTWGYNFLKREDSRLVLNFEQDPWSGYLNLNLSYANTDTNLALGFIKEVEVYMKDNNFYIGEKIDAFGNFLPIEDLDFEDLVLPEKQKKALKLGVLDFFNKKELYIKNNISFKRGILLTGVPGTGKSFFGKILMKATTSTFIWATANELQSDSDIKYLFKMAGELGDVILYLEDIDNYLEKTGAVDILKTTLDGLAGENEGIVTVLCTNFPDRIPKALLRPGRMDDVFILQLPDESLRLKILKTISKTWEIEDADNVLKDLASNTQGLTPACLKEILIYSLLLTADDGREVITKIEVNTALDKVKDSRETITERLSEIDEKKLIIEIKKLNNVKTKKN